MSGENDDFLSDVSSAVDNGGSLPVTNDVTPASPQQTQQPAQQSRGTKSVEQNVLDIMAQGDEEVDLLQGIAPPAPKQEQKPVTQQQREKLSLPDKAEPAKKVEENVAYNQQRGQPSPLDTFLQDDGKGNLTLADGTIIAQAGKARAHFEAVKKAGREAREKAAEIASSSMKLAQRFQDLYTEYKDIEKGGMGHLAKTVGMTEAEVRDAITLMTEYKNNPVQAIKNILTRAHMSGINIKDIGFANAPVDAATVTSVVRSQLQDLLGPLQQQREQAETNTKAVEEATKFLQAFPDAQKFVEPIEKAKAQFPDMSYYEIWARLLPYLPSVKDPAPTTAPQTDTTVVTTHQPPQQQQRQPGQRPYNTLRNPDYSTMSFNDIAAQILKEQQAL